MYRISSSCAKKTESDLSADMNPPKFLSKLLRNEPTYRMQIKLSLLQKTKKDKAELASLNNTEINFAIKIYLHTYRSGLKLSFLTKLTVRVSLSWVCGTVFIGLGFRYWFIWYFEVQIVFKCLVCTIVLFLCLMQVFSVLLSLVI